MKKIALITASLALLARPVFAQEAKTVGNAPLEAKFSTVSKDEMFSSKLKGLNVYNQKDETVGEITDIAIKNNQIDALILSSDDDTESGVVLREAAEEAELIAVTAGAQGGSWRTDGDEGRWAAVLPPGPIVDTYGCGDAFAAGFLSGLLRGFATHAALRLANRCGALAMLSPGDMESLPRRAEVEEEAVGDIRR